MPVFSSSRVVLAAVVLLALFSSAYRLALRWPGLPSARRLAVADHAAPPAPAAPPKPDEPEVRDPLEVFEHGSPMARRPRLLRRYVGTIGGEPATALLEWQNPDSVRGSFHWQRRGPTYSFAADINPHPRMAPALFVQEMMAWDEAGWLQLHGRPGALLTGTWRGGPAGRAVPVVLRESYAGAVRLAVRTEWVHGRLTPDDHYGYKHTSVAWVQYEFLQLLHPATVPAALRPLLAPGPAGRRHQLRTSGEFDCATYYEVRVALNEGGLLSYQYSEECSPLGGQYYLRFHNTLLDVVGGRRLTPQSQLIPHYEPALARLLARRLLREPAYRPLMRAITQDSSWQRQQQGRRGQATQAALTRWLRTRAQTSAEEALFTGAGLEIENDESFDIRPLFSDAMQTTICNWFIPYAELRPLVRPGTPLARLLQARGLW